MREKIFFSSMTYRVSIRNTTKYLKKNTRKLCVRNASVRAFSADVNDRLSIGLPEGYEQACFLSKHLQRGACYEKSEN